MSEKESSSDSNLAFHAENLSDEAKIEKFMEAFEMNHGFFEGKIVLNVGCGHGLLSMLAAKVGQSSIYEASLPIVIQFLVDQNYEYASYVYNIGLRFMCV